jgi:hypothetical protein
VNPNYKKQAREETVHFIKTNEQTLLTVTDHENLGQPKKQPNAKKEITFNRVRNG